MLAIINQNNPYLPRNSWVKFTSDGWEEVYVTTEKGKTRVSFFTGKTFEHNQLLPFILIIMKEGPDVGANRRDVRRAFSEVLGPDLPPELGPDILDS